MKRTRLSPVSKKRRGEADERRAVLERTRSRDRNECQAGVRIRHRLPYDQDAGKCDGPLDGHEIIPRSAWPGGHLVDDNVLTVCRLHHDWIHAHPVSAYTLGLLSQSWNRP